MILIHVNLDKESMKKMRIDFSIGIYEERYTEV